MFSSTTTFVPVYGQGISKLNSFKPVNKPSFGVTIDGRPATGLQRSSSVDVLSLPSTPNQFGTGSMFSRGLSDNKPSFGVTIDGRPAMGKGQSVNFGSSKPSENTSSFFGVYPVRGSEYKPNINAQMGNRRKSHYIVSQPGFDNYYG